MKRSNGIGVRTGGRGCAGGRRVAAMAVVSGVVVSVLSPLAAPPAAAEPVEAIDQRVTQRVGVPDAHGRTPVSDSMVSIDLAGDTLAWVEQFRSPQDRYWVMDEGTPTDAPELQELAVPGRPTFLWEGSDLSSDGKAFVATYRVDSAGLGDCARDSSDPDVGIHYWVNQVVRWQRASPTGAFGDPELVSSSIEPISGDCDEFGQHPSDPDGPAFMGRGGEDHSYQPSVSGDGSVVAFTSSARDLGGGLPPLHSNDRGVYVWREGVGVEAIAPGLDGDSRDPQVSADGTAVVFVSDAPDVVSGHDPDGEWAVYMARLDAGTWDVELVSTNGAGEPAEVEGAPAWSGVPAVDGDGSRIAFVTDADNIDDDVALTGWPVVVVKDLDTGTTRILRDRYESPQAERIGEIVGRPDLSDDGSMIAVYGSPESGATLRAAPGDDVDRLVVFDIDRALDSDADVRRTARVSSREYQSFVNSWQDVSIAGEEADYLVAFDASSAPEGPP